ncbi:MAG: helix-turn-helix domain-containing protein [Pseudomonadota bacterium]
MKWSDLSDDPCPAARGMAVIGDRWTLLILRDCFSGIRRYEAFQKRLGITRHVLADRLRRLEAEGVLRRERYQERPPRDEYRLTEKGKALFPVLAALMDWADRYAPVENGLRLVDADSGEALRPRLVDAEGAEVSPRRARVARG